MGEAHGIEICVVAVVDEDLVLRESGAPVLAKVTAACLTHNGSSYGGPADLRGGGVGRHAELHHEPLDIPEELGVVEVPDLAEARNGRLHWRPVPCHLHTKPPFEVSEPAIVPGRLLREFGIRECGVCTLWQGRGRGGPSAFAASAAPASLTGPLWVRPSGHPRPRSFRSPPRRSSVLSGCREAQGGGGQGATHRRLRWRWETEAYRALEIVEPMARGESAAGTHVRADLQCGPGGELLRSENLGVDLDYVAHTEGSSRPSTTGARSPGRCRTSPPRRASRRAIGRGAARGPG